MANISSDIFSSNLVADPRRVCYMHPAAVATATLARWARKAGKRFCKRPTDNTLATVLPRPLPYQAPARYSTTGDMRRLDSADYPLEYAQLGSAHSQAMQALRRSQPSPRLPHVDYILHTLLQQPKGCGAPLPHCDGGPVSLSFFCGADAH